MEEKSLSLYRGTVEEFIEKKSKFIVTVIPVETVIEVESELEQIRKRYWDASHNCYAFVLGENGRDQRCSDDGEPSGTAGKPILDVINGRKINNVLVVVTRYFGGTKLGPGGLVRAYSEASKLGLAGSVLVEKMKGQMLSFRTDYNGIGKVQYILGQRSIHITNSEYTDIVTVECVVPVHMVGDVQKEITESTSGRAEISEGKERWFAEVEGELMFF